jgi:cytochrome c553
VKAHFETLEDQASAKDTAGFEKTYRKVMNNCTVCHADTKHGFIQVKIPEYNPYPNLAY